MVIALLRSDSGLQHPGKQRSKSRKAVEEAESCLENFLVLSDRAVRLAR
jgi:hypothetical protein